MKYNLIALFTLAILVWMSACGAEPGQKNQSAAMLELETRLPATPLYLNQPLPVTVILRNVGSEPVLVNNRLSVGYQNSFPRELYAEFKDAKTGRLAKFHPYDINRNFSEPGDYRSLPPGDSILTTFNFLEYYPVKKSGKYRLTLHYQADEKMASPPAGIWAGVVSSEPVLLEILPGKLPGIGN